MINKKILFIFLLTTRLILAQENVEDRPQSPNQFLSKTMLKNPLDLRDPFKRKMSKRKAQLKKAISNGIYSNQMDIIENKPIESIRIIGVVVGKDRRAMAKINDGKKMSDEVYFIKEGMKIGPNGAEVKAILPGGIVLVEKVRNVYDQDEYLETVIPVSNE